MSNNKILLVEDDQNFGDVLRSYLEMHDYDVTLATDGVQGFEAYKKEEFDLCIFDVMMPKKDGFTLAKEIRERDAEMPIIFLTAKTLKDDVLQGFKIGADDYITKPYSVGELLARVRANLRRVRPVRAGQVLEVGDLRLDGETHRVSRGGVSVHLGPTEFRLLSALMEKPGRVWTREALLDRVWGRDIYVDTRTVDVHVGRLRKALMAPGGGDPIRTVRGAGYALD